MSRRFVLNHFLLFVHFIGRNFVRHYSTKQITTHYTVVPRETDPRWKGKYWSCWIWNWV